MQGVRGFASLGGRLRSCAVGTMEGAGGDGTHSVTKIRVTTGLFFFRQDISPIGTEGVAMWDHLEGLLSVWEDETGNRARNDKSWTLVFMKFVEGMAWRVVGEGIRKFLHAGRTRDGENIFIGLRNE